MGMRPVPTWNSTEAAGKSFEYRIYTDAPGGHAFNRLDTKFARETYGLDDTQPLAFGVWFEVPGPTRREVVVDRDGVNPGVGQEAVDEMAADEPRSPDEEEPRTGRQRSDSHFGVAV